MAATKIPNLLIFVIVFLFICNSSRVSLIAVSLKFLCYILNQITYSYKTSESNNGKLDIIHMENVLVPIPISSNDEIDIDIQKKIIKEYEKLEFLKEKLTSILKEIEL